jgi:hypothetical protein
LSRVISRTAIAVVLGVTPYASSAAQEPASPGVEASASDSAAAADSVESTLEPAAPTEIKLPALTIVELRVVDEITSKTALPGQSVRLALARPVYFAPELGLPEGTPVEGVVIHAAKGGMGGKSGELLLGAKKISLTADVGIPLRSFKLGPARGKNNETLAFASSVAGGAIGSVAALFITGGSAMVPAGMEANAKTSSDAVVPTVLLAKLPPIQAQAAVPVQEQPSSTPANPTQTNPTQGESK